MQAARSRSLIAAAITLRLGLAVALIAGFLTVPALAAPSFVDVPSQDVHHRAVTALAHAGVTTGCTEDRFCPTQPLTRAQAATLLHRALDLPPGTPASFTDVPPGHPHHAGITALAHAGFTTGCTEDRFCPTQPLTRAQAATLLHRALQDRPRVPEVPARGPQPGQRCPGSVVQPGQDIQGALDAAGAQGAVCLAAGTHRISAPLRGHVGQTITGQHGAVLSGAVLAAGWVPDGGRWRLDGWTRRMPHVPARDGRFDHCLADRPLCGHADTVFLDDAALLQVAGPHELAAGRFWFDYANDRIWIAEDPSGRRVEVTASPEAFSYSPAVHEVTIANLVVEKFGNAAQTGAINTGEGWTVRHSEVRLNHGAGVRLGSRSLLLSSRVLDQGQIGVTGWGHGVRVEDNEIAGNNTAGYNPYWEAGGSKWARTTGLVVRDNWVHNNRGPGLWTDIDNRQTLYEHNLVEHNDLAGIFHEISFDAVIRHNVTRHNGFGHRHWWAEGAGILLMNSRDVTVHDNTVVDNAGGIVVRADNRGAWVVANITVHDNQVRLTNGGSGMVSTSSDLSVFDSGVRFFRNHYEVDLDATPFEWHRAPRSIEEWVRFGHDREATFQPLPPRD